MWLQHVATLQPDLIIYTGEAARGLGSERSREGSDFVFSGPEHTETLSRVKCAPENVSVQCIVLVDFKFC